MIVDTSAIVAVFQHEPERDEFLTALFRAPAVRMSPVNWFEASIVAERTGPTSRQKLGEILADCKAEIVPVDKRLMTLAFEGWRRFGKGRHRAGLNLGDCFAYALARSLDEPLLFKGNDFRHTDVTAAL